MPIRWPLLAIRPGEHASLIARCHELVRGSAARVSSLPLETDDTAASGWLRIDAWLTCDDANLEAARRALASDLEVGDEVGVDLWNLGPEAAATLEVDLATWQAFRLGVLTSLREAFHAGHHLSSDVKAAWLNLDYAATVNARTPALNPQAPGKPYFDGEGPPLPGQWVRVVVTLASGDDFWCVGHVVGGDEHEVYFSDLGYEGGAEAVDESVRSWVKGFRVVRGIAQRADDGIFDVVTLEAPAAE